ncbi:MULTISPECIES: complex I subunit 5 family protein [unclassified Sphingobium]|uniref:complex I subunit 5 family protein n=1 Tax=unclassified Sphingobium TaxID=2611147 RepID=UPI002223FC51|nr:MULTISPECIES: proton-conducting transporter membrane subunit [unclassified Sphingobium]MCW2410930.1 multicomponent Na+:H+ antiporter subunit D [Sphingobium sp. B8D3D]MCW2416779.1 multicomponent Na+:H+ antiporter subunit D [Sphingobium sp. B8D3A]
MTDALLLPAPVILPFIGAALVLILRARIALTRAIGLITNGLLLVVSLLLFVQANGGNLVPLTVFGGWPHGISISFSATMPGLVLVVVTALIAFASAIYALVDVGPRRRRAGYDALMLAMTGAVNGAFLTRDLFNLYVWFELALIAALGLLTLDRRPAQIDGAIRYASFSMLAATFILLGVGMIYGITGTLDVGAAATALASRPPSFASATATALLMAGFALKAGLFPFHLWLPASYHTGPITAVAVFAGLLTKMGFYALLLVFAGVFGVGAGGIGAAQMVPVFGWIAAATILICCAGALAHTDMRRILAYHIVAQVGYMTMGLAIATREGIAGAVFYMVHSIIVQANLFLGAGLIRRASGSWDLTRAGGMARTNPLFSLVLAVPVLSLAGIPPLSGFWAKFIVIRESFDAGMAWLGIIALIGGLMTIVSMSIFWSDACWKEPRGKPVRKVPLAGLIAMAILSGATIAIGLLPQSLWTLSLLSSRALAVVSGGGL